MSKTVYTLRKKQDTDEYHLFVCTSTGNGNCSCKRKSVCNKMDHSEKEEGFGFACEDERSTRIEAAKIGRAVCGTCISHLYATEEDN